MSSYSILPFALLTLACLLSAVVERCEAQSADLTPQTNVECLGRHALCTSALCTSAGACDCWIFDSINTVVSASILNETLLEATQSQCTNSTPCGVNDAPICTAMNHDAYYVDGVLAWAVSTFSWEGYCQLLDQVVCASSPWTNCMAAPCTMRNDNSSLALCQCPIVTSTWVDFQWPNSDSNCAYDDGIIVSSVGGDTDPFAMPGVDYFLEGCDTRSDDDDDSGNTAPQQIVSGSISCVVGLVVGAVLVDNMF